MPHASVPRSVQLTGTRADSKHHICLSWSGGIAGGIHRCCFSPGEILESGATVYFALRVLRPRRLTFLWLCLKAISFPALRGLVPTSTAASTSYV